MYHKLFYLPCLVRNLPPGFPRIMKNPSGQSIYTGDDARYECNATGNPTPMISWMVDRFPLNLSNPRYSIPSRGVLTVANIQPEDHGIAFECVAANINGMVYSRRTRLIHKGLYFSDILKIVVDENNKATRTKGFVQYQTIR